MEKELVFRISFEYVKESVDVVQFLNQLGTDLFLVLHQKPGNYHYHSYLKVTQCVRTIRDKLKYIIDWNMKIERGFRPVTLSDKVNDADRYKSYCLYRAGHPIKNIYVKDDLDSLKQIHETVENTPQVNLQLKQEKELQEVLLLCKEGMNIRQIVEVIVKYYKKTGRVVHITKMQQLAWSVIMHKGNDEMLINKIIQTDDHLSAENDRLECVEKKRIDSLTIDYDSIA